MDIRSFLKKLTVLEFITMIILDAQIVPNLAYGSPFKPVPVSFMSFPSPPSVFPSNQFLSTPMLSVIRCLRLSP